jgi:alpha-tubulin suppressor-like RCC1 family protein
MSMLYCVGSNKKGELGIGNFKACSCLEPIHLYIYDGIYESEEIVEEISIDHSLKHIPPSLKDVLSKIPDGIGIRSMNGIRSGSCGACYTVLYTDDGKFLFAGLNDAGQMGLQQLVGNLPLPLFFNIVGRDRHQIDSVSCGFDHTV